MRVLGFECLRPALVFAILGLLPGSAQGQQRPVVSNEIAVSETEASLKLGFPDGQDLTVSFRGGQILVDRDPIGSYTRRDELDLAWRSLLGEVITLDDGPLAARLNDWDPPEGLTGEALDVAQRLDRILEEALTAPDVAQDSPQADVTPGPEAEESLLTALLTRTEALSRLSRTLEGVSLDLDHVTLKVGEDVVLESGEVLDGDLILVDGNLDIGGRIDGDVVVVGGTVTLREGGVVTGDLRLSDGALERDGGSVGGRVTEISAGDPDQMDRAELEDLRHQLESEIRRDLRTTVRPEIHRPNIFVGILGNFGSAIAGLLEQLITFIVLAILGVMAVHFQRDRLEVIATTARRAPVRAAVVGLAGGFFLLPVWIVGAIALAITIIGIPVLLVWIPVFPIAAALAILFGYLAVARNVGEWVAEQEYRGLEWIRGSNTFYTIVAGVGALLVPAVAGSASRILGFGLLTGLLGSVASMVTFAAAAVGLGAVLLTRGGKIRPLESYYDFEEDYWADTPARAESDDVGSGPDLEIQQEEPKEGHDEQA